MEKKEKSMRFQEQLSIEKLTVFFNLKLFIES
jgi:hypothetical protein